jgi:hypothetical protein
MMIFLGCVEFYKQYLEKNSYMRIKLVVHLYWFAKFANEMMYLDHAERFLSEHLAGDCRQVDSNILAGSSAQVSN